MNPDNTTPSTGWTYKHEGHEWYSVIDPLGNEFVCELELDQAKQICDNFNRLHSLDTASEVDVSDEAIKIAAYKYSHWHETVKSYTHGMNTMRNALLPQLAKAKADNHSLSVTNGHLNESNKLLGDLLSASQAEVERKDEALKKLRAYFGQNDKTTQEHLMYHVADKALNKP